MKRIFIIICMFLLVFYFNKEEYIMDDDSIRFRVIANSNSIEDIIMKEKVVESLSDFLFTKSKSKNDTKNNIIVNLKNIENKINELFKNNNYTKTYNVLYGLNEFPKKEYKGKVYEKGLYESLVIEIGEAKGNNYWCFLYPSLCISDYEKTEEKNEYGFKLIEILKDLF